MSRAGEASRTEMKYEILWDLGVRTKGEIEIAHTNKVREPSTGF